MKNTIRLWICWMIFSSFGVLMDVTTFLDVKDPFLLYPFVNYYQHKTTNSSDNFLSQRPKSLLMAMEIDQSARHFHQSEKL